MLWIGDGAKAHLSELMVGSRTRVIHQMVCFLCVLHWQGWLGLFSSRERVAPSVQTPLDALCQLCQNKLIYAPGERDMLVMKHTFEVTLLYFVYILIFIYNIVSRLYYIFTDYHFQVSYRPANRTTITSTMLDFGLQSVGGFSSMSRTVSLPVALIAVTKIYILDF